MNFQLIKENIVGDKLVNMLKKEKIKIHNIYEQTYYINKRTNEILKNDLNIKIKKKLQKY